MDDIYKNIEKCNPPPPHPPPPRSSKKSQLLIIFDYIIADMHNNKKLNPIVTELFIEGRKLNISQY